VFPEGSRTVFQLQSFLRQHPARRVLAQGGTERSRALIERFPRLRERLHQRAGLLSAASSRCSRSLAA